MSENFENRKNEVALRRFAAVSFIEQKVREGLGVVQALRLAALRPWPDENGRYSSARTLEDYWYAWKSGGFAALQPKSRDDEGTFRKMPAEVGQWLLSQVSQYPEIPLKVLYERWTKAGQPLPSLRTLYRFLRSKGYDAASLRRGRLETGPTKAFEAPFVNDLWMTDFSPEPKLNIDGKVFATHLCLILDDHSRLITFSVGGSQSDLSSSQGTLSCFCPALRPRSDLRAKPFAALRFCPRGQDYEGSNVERYFEAQSHVFRPAPYASCRHL